MPPEGILHIVFDCGTEPAPDEAAAFLEVGRELIGSEVPPVLIGVVRVPYIERHLRSYFMREPESPPCRALVATNPSHVTLWGSFRLVDPSRMPSRLFRTTDRAVVWIQEQMGAG